MRRVLLLSAVALLVVGHVLAVSPRAVAQTGAATQCQTPIECVVFDSVAEWQTGLVDGLLVSNNEGGEVRLAERSREGSFTTGYIQTVKVVGAAGAVWFADVPAGTRLTLELRGGETQEQARTAAWQPLAAGDARSQVDAPAFALEAVLPLLAETRYVQLRARFSSEVENASPVLSKITLQLIEPIPGPAAAGLPRVDAPFGPPTLTLPPRIVQRTDWDPDAPAVPLARQNPTGIVIHQIGTNDIGPNPLGFLRASALYSTRSLGWDDMPFHFVIDAEGTIYEGHTGGPTAVVPRLAGGASVVHVALIGSPSQAAQDSLGGLLAWLGQAYSIPPLGQYAVPSPSGGAPVARPTIAAHNEVVPEAADPSLEVRALLPGLRTSADQRTVRARWYFAEGNPRDYSMRLAVTNPSSAQARVTFAVLRSAGATVIRSTNVDPGARADLVVSDLFNDTSDAPSIIEANAPVVAEQFLDNRRDLSVGPGITRLSRVWYFAEGSTEGDAQSFLVLFNPQTDDALATITYMRGDGTTAELKNVRIPARKRTVVPVGDALPGAAFGAKIIATRPIAAERTMTFGGPAPGGFHTAPGLTELSRRWFFAEGTTAPPFQMRMLVLNPNAQPVTATVTFLTASGTSLTRRYAIPPTTRLRINVNEVVPELGVATRVEADRPVVVERSLTWRNGTAGSASPGATAPAFVWRFADGRTHNGFQQFLLFNNPDSNHQARVTVEFTLADGKRAAQSIVMPGGSRYTMAVHDLYPNQQTISAVVRSTFPIVVERSIFAGAPGADTNQGGGTALGVPGP